MILGCNRGMFLCFFVSFYWVAIRQSSQNLSGIYSFYFSEFYSRKCFVIFELNLLPNLKKVKDLKKGEDIKK